MWSAIGWMLALALLSGAASGEEAAEGASPDEGPPAEAGAPVGLDALFRLPSGPGSGRRIDATSSERHRWEERFSSVRADLAEAQQKLAEAQDELETLARSTDSWQMAAPGATHDPETSPISYKLRSDIRRYREDIARAEKRLRELEVEASLAGVPAEWRRPPHEDAAPDS